MTRSRGRASPSRRQTERKDAGEGEKVAVLGLGKAGGSLLASLGAARVDVVARARRPDDLFKKRGLEDATLLVLAVPDASLADVAADLARRRSVPPFVVHMSGALGLDALSPLAHRVAVGSFHPLASLDGRRPIPAGTLIAWDASGGRRGARALPALARRVQGKPVRLTDAERARYHAGAVVAGNLPVALLAAGVQLLVEAGVPKELARVSLARLLRTQAENAEKAPLALALTGPLARGDASTLRRHLDVLDENHAELASIYRQLSRVLVDEVVAHPPGVKAALRRALAASSAQGIRRRQ